MNDTPGIGSSIIELTLTNFWFPKPQEQVEYFKTLPWYLRWLGFYLIYQALIMDEPVQVIEGWTYHIKPVSYQWYWLGIKLKTIQLP